MRSFPSALAVTIFLAASSNAQAEDYNWTGFSASVGVGGSAFDNDIKLTDTSTFSRRRECVVVPNVPNNAGTCFEGILPFVSGINSNSVSSSDNDKAVFGTVGLAADYQLGRYLVVGAFADIDLANGDSEDDGATTSGFGPIGVFKSTTSISTKYDYDYQWTIGGRLGVLSLNRQALIYVLGGYTELHGDGSAKITDTATGFDVPLFGGSSTVELPDNFRGFTVGAGTEVKLSSSWSIKLEGRYSNLNSESVDYSTTSSSKTSGGIFNNGPGCTNGANGVDCELITTRTTSSSGSFEMDPNIWSGRAALSFKLN